MVWLGFRCGIGEVNCTWNQANVVYSGCVEKSAATVIDFWDNNCRYVLINKIGQMRVTVTERNERYSYSKERVDNLGNIVQFAKGSF